MFRSARLKLTLFYLAILVFCSLIITFSIRVLAEREYLQANGRQRGEIKQLVFDPDFVGQFDITPYYRFQQTQEDLMRQRLNQDMIIINIAILMIGGLLSYWFAGRTLRPIEEAHEAQARFAADASHELRTPLTNLRLENEVFLRQKGFTETEARAQIASNLEEVQRLEDLSTNLLALTQYGNATELTLGIVDVKPLARAAVKQVDRLAEAKKVTIKIEAQPGKLRGNHDSLVQLLTILLDNAIKYGPTKGEVVVGGKSQDGHYLLWVQDQGPGIDEADLPHIFERLYRGDKARSSKVSGYGLGLPLAQAIAAANHAEIRAVNQSPGACLMLHIPLVK